jgi:tetratricopeptide (TPR) repeat protein
MKTHIIKKILIIAGFVLAAFNLSPAARAADAELTVLEEKIERAHYRRDATLLTEAEGELAAALKAQPDRVALRYLEGFAAYARAALEHGAKDKKALDRGLVRADGLLAKVKGEPWASEALGLRGYITGQLIGARGSMSGMTLGPKMMRQTSEALDGAPESGRMLTFHGVTLLNTPEMFGGDPKEALRLFTRATAAFDKASAAESATWGEAQAWAWLAQARVKAGDFEGAKDAADKALVCDPEYRWVRSHLLPMIEKKLAPK